MKVESSGKLVNRPNFMNDSLMAQLEVWREEHIFHSGQEYFDALESELRAAKVSIDLETYIYDDDELGALFAKLLCEKASQGVAVRVMVDGVGSPGFLSRFGEDFAASGVDVRVYNPFRFFWVANQRNHRKVVIVDQTSAWTGGINISAKQASRFSGSKAWRDTGIRVVGDAIVELQRAFDTAWAQAWNPFNQKRITYFFRKYRTRRGRFGNHLVQLNFTRRLRKRTNAELIRNIHSASERIWITTAYFIPESKVMRAMKRVARRGIDVRIIVPCRSDVFFTPWVGAAFYHTLLKSGVKIFEYQPCMIHAKTIVIDSWGMVGSANLNHRSMFHDLEVSLVVQSPKSIESLTNQFLIDQSKSRVITIADWKNRPLLVRFFGNLLFYLKYWF